VRPTGRFVAASSRCRPALLLRLERGEAGLVCQILLRVIRSHVEK
jgi:hypothetical protein